MILSIEFIPKKNYNEYHKLKSVEHDSQINVKKKGEMHPSIIEKNYLTKVFNILICINLRVTNKKPYKQFLKRTLS